MKKSYGARSGERAGHGTPPWIEMRQPGNISLRTSIDGRDVRVNSCTTWILLGWNLRSHFIILRTDQSEIFRALGWLLAERDGDLEAAILTIWMFSSLRIYLGLPVGFFFLAEDVIIKFCTHRCMVRWVGSGTFLFNFKWFLKILRVKLIDSWNLK